MGRGMKGGAYIGKYKEMLGVRVEGMTVKQKQPGNTCKQGKAQM